VICNSTLTTNETCQRNSKLAEPACANEIRKIRARLCENLYIRCSVEHKIAIVKWFKEPTSKVICAFTLATNKMSFVDERSFYATGSVLSAEDLGGRIMLPADPIPGQQHIRALLCQDLEG